METIKMMILLTITVGIFAWAPTPQRKQRPSKEPFRKSWSCILPRQRWNIFAKSCNHTKYFRSSIPRNNAFLICFNTVCFASSVVNILLLRVLGKISILCSCSLFCSQPKKVTSGRCSWNTAGYFRICTFSTFLHSQKITLFAPGGGGACILCPPVTYLCITVQIRTFMSGSKEIDFSQL